MSWVALAIRRPVTVFISAVAAVVFGWVAFGQLATDLLPDITYPSLTLRTELAGAAPAEVESLLTRPIENAVGVVENLVRATSSSRAGVSEVTLKFAWGTSMDFAALDVRERLDRVQLPLDAEPPILLRYDPSLDPILRVALVGEGDLVRLRRVAEEKVKRPLERLEGVAAAVVQGGLEEELQVEVDERALANFGFDLDRLIARVAEENIDLTGGRLQDGQTEYLVRTVNELLRPENLEELVLSTEGGALVRLGDVATAQRGHREREIVTRYDGRESVEIAIYKAGGGNTVRVSETVRERLETLRGELERIDPELGLVLISDQARYIRKSVSEVLRTALYGGALAIGVLFLFLRSWKTTLIIGLSIPISVVATFFLMYGAGVSLNIMSLGGLTLGIGLMVDNAIVVLESIHQRREALSAEGLRDDVEAARRGAGEVASAIVASTFTSICVFLPIVFVDGVAAQLFADQALTVTFALLMSLAVALTVVPMLASRGGGGKGVAKTEGGRSRSWLFRPTVAVARGIRVLARGFAALVGYFTDPPARLFQRAFAVLARLYGRCLDGALGHPWLVLLATLMVMGASLTLYPKLGRELVPELVQGEFFVDLELPAGTHLEVTRRRVAQLESVALGLDGVAGVSSVAGSSSQQGGVAGDRRENLGQVAITVEAPFSRQIEERLMAALRSAVATEEGVEARFQRPSYFSFKTPVEVEIRGYNLQLLRRYSDRLVERMRAMEGVTDVESSAEGGRPELQVRFDRERLARLGLSLEDVAAVVRSKVEGRVATEIQRDDRTIDIRLRSQERFRDSVGDLLDLTVHQRGKTALPLRAVAEVTEAEGPAEIRRSDGERVAVITANLAGRDLGAVTEEITTALADLDLPDSFDWRMGGQRQEMETSFDSLRLALLLAVFLVYLVMASQFESLRHPLIILMSVPFALVGVLATLYAFDITLSVVSLIGVVLLAGLVVNNAILLVDATNRFRRDGAACLEALRRAGRSRFRPILMTTVTTALGLLPMAIGLGEGSELRAPMAWVVIGGLLASTVLTLVILPVVYRLVDPG